MRLTREMLLLAVLLLPGLLSAAPAATPALPAPSGHRPGLRDQWQPRTEHDPRLQQPVQIEIIGRVATAAMQLLSEKTGVSLGVAPENLDTVGERKLTIIAQGCSLKALLVQIPKALQECHVDIDTTGKEPVYLLHRNGDADTAMVQAGRDWGRRLEGKGRAGREARLAAAHRALAMSPVELAELAKTDPLLAAAARDTQARPWMAAVLSLPAAAQDELIATGRTRVDYTSLPASARDLVQSGLRSSLPKAGPNAGALAALADSLRATGEGSVFFSEAPSADFDAEITIGIGAKGLPGPNLGGLRAIPPRLPDQGAAGLWRELVARSGLAGEKGADAFLADLTRQHDREEQAARDARRAAEWREPPRPELHRVITLPFSGPTDPVEVQRFVARASGLSLVSDYFTAWGERSLPEEVNAPLPIWRALYVLGDNWFWGYDWNQAGDCLVFHDQLWWSLVWQECPESLLTIAREKLARQGRLSLDDAAAFAVGLARRPPKPAELGPIVIPRIPADLQKVGLARLAFYPLEPLLIYASLSPDEREKAGSAAGLAYPEMTPAQRDLVSRCSVVHPGRRIAPAGEIPTAVYRVTRSTRDSAKSGPYPPPEPGPKDVFELSVEFARGKVSVALWLRPLGASSR